MGGKKGDGREKGRRAGEEERRGRREKEWGELTRGQGEGDGYLPWEQSCVRNHFKDTGLTSTLVSNYYHLCV